MQLNMDSEMKRKAFRKMRELEKNPDKIYKLFEIADNLDILIGQFHYAPVLAMINRLWKPGTFTVEDIVEDTNESKHMVNKYVNSLLNLKVIKDKCLGIYGADKYGNLMMALYAWLVSELE